MVSGMRSSSTYPVWEMHIMLLKGKNFEVLASLYLSADSKSNIQ